MQKIQHEFKWALGFTAVGLLWMALEKMMGWHGEKIADHPTYTNLFAIVAIAVYVFALLGKRKELGGSMSWKQGFVSGAIISVIGAMLSPLAQWLTHKVITPEYFPNAIRHSVERGLMQQADAEAMFNLGNYIMLASVSGLVIGIVTAAVVAIFVQKK